MPASPIGGCCYRHAVEGRPDRFKRAGRATDDQWVGASQQSVVGATPAAPPWAEWTRLGRFLDSARLAFERERGAWGRLKGADPGRVIQNGSAQPSRRKVTLQHHLAAVQDDEPLLASVLVLSYALAESFAARRLDTEARLLNGIEDWGERLLVAAGRDWTAVRGGLAGAVEVAVVRNAFAHGAETIDEHADTRLRRAGVTDRAAGSRVTISYPECSEFRARLSSLMSLGARTASPPSDSNR